MCNDAIQAVDLQRLQTLMLVTCSILARGYAEGRHSARALSLCTINKCPAGDTQERPQRTHTSERARPLLQQGHQALARVAAAVQHLLNVFRGLYGHLLRSKISSHSKALCRGLAHKNKKLSGSILR